MARNTFKKKEAADTKEKVTKAKKKAVQTRGKGVKAPKFLKDPKFRQLMGLLLMTTSFAFLLAFTSYFFTGNADQSILELPIESIEKDEIQNWLGKFGARISQAFMGEWFGLAAYIFVLLFFIAGFNLLTRISLLPFQSALKQSVLILWWLPPALAFIVRVPDLLFLGGGFGHSMVGWLEKAIGFAGTAALLIFTATAWAMVKFDIQFLPNKTQEEDLKDVAQPAEGQLGDELNETPQEITHDEELPEEYEPRLEVPPIVEFDNEFSESDEEVEVKNETAPLEIVEEELPKEVEASIELSTTPPPASETDASETDQNNELEIEESAKEEILSEKEVDKKLQDTGEYDPTLDLGRYQMPVLELLEDHGTGNISINREELETNKNRIVETLGNYKIEIDKIKATVGPTVTLYEIVPAAGVRISKIKNLEDDIALSLAALGIRIIAPIPGKGTIGIEVPNQNADVVSMRSLIASEKFQSNKYELPIAIGKTISNESFVTDLAKMPHLLMAGATGQGKSVGLNAILVSLLYRKHPSQIKFVLVDPKKVELTLFNKIERHYLAKLPDSEEAIITDTTKVVHTLNSLCIEMDQRYEMLKNAMCRNIKEFNKKFVERKLNPEKGFKYLPYIVLVVDEFADLIMTAGKEVETPIARLAQLARAVGIHLIIATQRPSVNVITGIIKANFPSRISFRVTSKIDSRTILDAGGADQLIGRGDMLLSTGNELIRLQCGFVDTPEVEAICEYIGGQQGYPEAFQLPEYVDESGAGSGESLVDMDRDALFGEAARLVVQHQQGSASLLQRRLKLGYNRAGRIVDQLEAAGIIGPFEGSKARQVLVPDEMALEQLLESIS